jgi:Antibiotic biosynthesis monooxygenase
MATETQDIRPITLINIFEIRPEDVEEFLQQWQERAEFLGRQPGFRSLRLHQALQAATALDFFQQSAQHSVQEFAVAAHPAVYRAVIEATAG